jgi:hypothetical protein
MANKRGEKNYQSYRLDWRKEDTERTRRKNALNSKNGDLVDTGKALMSLAGRTSDQNASRKARADAVYFFAKYKRKLQLQGYPQKKLRRRV